MKQFHAHLEEGWREPCAYSSASALKGGLRPTLHSDWNVIAIGPLRMVENAVTRTMHHGAFEHFQEKWNPVFRPKMRQHKKNRAASASMETEAALVSRDNP
jgi:predicted amidohydrolase YtcJ